MKSTTVQQKSISSTPLLDVRQVSSLLKCSVRHVYRLVDTGRMPPPIRLGTLVRWSQNIIEDWVAKGCPPASTVNSFAEAEVGKE